MAVMMPTVLRHSIQCTPKSFACHGGIHPKHVPVLGMTIKISLPFMLREVLDMHGDGTSCSFCLARYCAA